MIASLGWINENGQPDDKGFKVKEIKEFYDLDLTEKAEKAKADAEALAKAGSVESVMDTLNAGITVRLNDKQVTKVKTADFFNTIHVVAINEQLASTGKTAIKSGEATLTGAVQGVAQYFLNTFPTRGNTHVIEVKGKGQVPCTEAVFRFVQFKENELDVRVKEELKKAWINPETQETIQGNLKPTLPGAYRNACTVTKSAMLNGVSLNPAEVTHNQVKESLKKHKADAREAELASGDASKVSDDTLRLSSSSLLARANAMLEKGELSKQAYHDFKLEFGERLIDLMQYMNDWLDTNATATPAVNPADVAPITKAA